MLLSLWDTSYREKLLTPTSVPSDQLRHLRMSLA